MRLIIPDTHFRSFLESRKLRYKWTSWILRVTISKRHCSRIIRTFVQLVHLLAIETIARGTLSTFWIGWRRVKISSREDFAKLSVQASSRCVLTFCLPGVLGCAFKRRQSFLNAFSISSEVTQLLPAAVAEFLASCKHSSNMLSTTSERTACARPDMTYVWPAIQN